MGKPSLIEVSVDETDTPQTPVELLLILAMIADEKIPVQTIAPKFSGPFNKGVDYVGDVFLFEKQFEEDLLVTGFAVTELGLPECLRLGKHSGSDKFSLYPIINRLIKKHRAGLHVKTVGTTWLEEVIGLAEAEGHGLKVATEIYCRALPHLTNPAYNAHFRQFLHVSLKVAAEMGAVYTDALETYAPIIARNVRDNLLSRHIKPIFG